MPAENSGEDISAPISAVVTGCAVRGSAREPWRNMELAAVAGKGAA
jgi:hypothetical protein